MKCRDAIAVALQIIYYGDRVNAACCLCNPLIIHLKYKYILFFCLLQRADSPLARVVGGLAPAEGVVLEMSVIFELPFFFFNLNCLIYFNLLILAPVQWPQT